MEKQLKNNHNCNDYLALLGMLDKATRKEQWLCSKCGTIYLKERKK